MQENSVRKNMTVRGVIESVTARYHVSYMRVKDWAAEQKKNNPI
jgi:hypothetical protein